ncbi:MAG: sulfatase-like hydrolase/transferase, partial [Verrucomicrobiota bacterium]|nr:sulfatase-like hydrolase/transferase [Verrucomicrobiota bacterium]
YYASVTFMDEQVGRILAELDRLKLRAKTAIVFTSDHGYHLGEHTFWQKSNLHEEVTRVPLVISLPGLKPGRSKSLVELVDLFPTLSAAAGLHAPESLHGTSLLPILNDPAARVKESALSIHSSGTSMRTASWTYTRYKDGSEELYDMKNDPGQFTNRANDAESAKTLAGQRKAFDKRLRTSDLKPARLR